MQSLRAKRRAVWTRRHFLAAGVRGTAYLALVRALTACGGGGSGDAAPPGGNEVPSGRFGEIPPLGAPLEIGLRIPDGFTARVIGEARQPVAGTGFDWHSDPDGAAIFKTGDGGWIYVSNREFLPGGADAIRFDAAGEIVDAYNILPGAQSRINCSGGATPWGTWMSCEEYALGNVFECDPFGLEAPQRWRALGTFSHEAVAVDPLTNVVYLTEDEPEGRFYRFVPDIANLGGRPDLSSGTLQIMKVLVSQTELDTPGLRGPTAVEWHDVPNPNPVLGGVLGTPTRQQLPETTAFDGGEGLWHHEGVIYFTTKGDRRVWAHRPADGTLEIVYDDALYAEPVLDSVDNILVTPGGDLVIVEDKSEANQQAVAITRDERIFALIELAGQEGSEVTGPAFSPDGQHFYFSSQRGPGANGSAGSNGITYCVSGPWFEV